VPRPVYVHVCQAALRHNIRRIKQYGSDKPIMAVVKANAYGHNLYKALPAIEDLVDAFAVVSPQEGIELRCLTSKPCIILQGIFTAEDLDIVLEHDLKPLIHNHEQISWLLAAQKNIGIWLEFDSGMHRLGFSYEELEDIITDLAEYDFIKILGIMTHFACADTPEHPVNKIQITNIERLVAKNYRVLLSNVASAAMVSFPEVYTDMLRPGIMLYGISPFADKTGKDLGLMPAMTFSSEIIAIKNYPPNSPIGYGGTWQSAKSSRIGIVAAGYADGYPRNLVKTAYVAIRGYVVPVVARVSMDSIMVDLSDFPEIALFDAVELWGEQIAVENVAACAATSAYELLSQVGGRVIFQDTKVGTLVT
jgi:alanine racemase